MFVCSNPPTEWPRDALGYNYIGKRNTDSHSDKRMNWSCKRLKKIILSFDNVAEMFCFIVKLITSFILKVSKKKKN